jgi:Fur family peroxide stress response transcriptional regulator
MFTQQELVEKFREWGVRITPQRLAVADVVLNTTDHPSVQQIQERVCRHFPSTTLATIYSTLGVLEKSGVIQELPFPRMSRYESNLQPHVNLVCEECGTITDANVGQEAVTHLTKRISRQANFQVARQRVDFYGKCRRCAAKLQGVSPTAG